VLLNKLESGFLLFQTQQGLVAVEPSFWQRVYLLWTFRNFRQLSLPLLNSRQVTLINSLFRENAPMVADEYEPSLEIGVVANFVPPAIEIGATPDAKTDVSTAVKEELLEPTADQYVAPAIIPIAAATAMEADVSPAVKWEDAEEEDTRIDGSEIAPGGALDRLFAPKASWLRMASPNLAASEPEASTSQVSRIVIVRLAAAIGALALCVCFIVAFHRNGAIPGPQAYSSPAPPASPDSSPAPEPTSVAENPATLPDSPPAPGPTSVVKDPATVPDGSPQDGDGPDTSAKPASGKVASSTTTTRRLITPERASRGGNAHVASRSSGGSHAAVSSRVPASAPTRRTTSEPMSRGAMARSAQSYFDLANQQMHKGNYAAAAANYKRAWRIQENSAAAKGRQVRARRAMQAEKESIANRRQKYAQ
jgi:hypothetical protein